MKGRSWLCLAKGTYAPGLEPEKTLLVQGSHPLICHARPPHALTTSDHRKHCPSWVLPFSEICPQQPGSQGRQTSRCLHPGLFPPVTSGLFLGRGDLLATTTDQLFIRAGKMAPEICLHPAQEGLTCSNDHTPRSPHHRVPAHHITYRGVAGSCQQGCTGGGGRAGGLVGRYGGMGATGLERGSLCGWELLQHLVSFGSHRNHLPLRPLEPPGIGALLSGDGAQLWGAQEWQKWPSVSPTATPLTHELDNSILRDTMCIVGI